MASYKPNTFKTPQKSSENKQSSSPFKINNHLRFRSPLANIQMSSAGTTSQYTAGSPMRFVSQSHCTPPQPFFKIRNPFEKTLIDHLHTPICSPGMFKIKESSGSFKWDIEQVSILRPADIVPCNSQFEPTPDPVLERKATEAIDRFFSQEMIVPSPLNEPMKQTNHLPIDPPDEHTTPDGAKISTSREVWTQTMLTLPSELPPEVENCLKQFYTLPKDQYGVGEADTSANASLRRKLCFEEVFSDIEDDQHSSLHNISCPIFHSPHVNALLCGMKRTFGTPTSRVSKTGYNDNHNTPGPNKTLSAEDLRFSPIVDDCFKVRHSYGMETCLRSPSLSPIGKSLEGNIHHKTSPKISLDKFDNIHHSCNASPFSQSTPEKSSIASKSSPKSSPDAANGSHVDINILDSKQIRNFTYSDDIHEVSQKKDKYFKRSKSETSLASLGRSRSAMKLDFNMDISSDVSMNFSDDRSPRCQSIIDDLDAHSPKPSSSYWEMEMAQIVSKSTDGAKASDYQKCNTDYITVNPKYKVVTKSTLFDYKRVTDEDENDRLMDVYQYLTPTKSKLNPNQFDRALGEHYSTLTKSSPVRMSIDNSFNIHPKFSGSSCERLTLENLNELGQAEVGKKKDEYRPGLHRMDSGFNELGLSHSSLVQLQPCELTVCNTTRPVDVTKSFCQTESSSVSWKRFDSGFNDEASSDFSHQLSCNENFKHPIRKPSPILEYSENKENRYFDEFLKMQERGQLVQDSMSISDIFAEDMVSFNCNFSSTPSKSLRQHK